MGNYKVIYLQYSECPICKSINRNVIEPVAVIFKKEDYEKYKSLINSIKNLESLKNNEEFFEKVINKDDLVCIFHQKKEGKHWKDDTEEFKKWNEWVLELGRNKILTDDKFNSLDEDNLVNQFWERIRAYRFAVDYIDLWKKSNRNWDNFKKELENLENKPDISEIEKSMNLIEFQLREN